MIIDACKNTVKELSIFDILFDSCYTSFWAGSYALIYQCKDEKIKTYITDAEDAYLYYVYVEEDSKMKDLAMEEGYDVTRNLNHQE